MIHVDRTERGLLRLAVGGQIPAPVVCPAHQWILVARSVLTFRKIIDLRKGVRHLVVIVPVREDRNERLRSGVVREVVLSRHPVFAA